MHLSFAAQYQGLRPSPTRGVFVENGDRRPPFLSLADSPFPSSICSVSDSSANENTPHLILLDQALSARGLRQSTPVQAYGWPYVLTGRDTVLVSPHGSGKTLAYLLPLLSQLAKRKTAGYEVRSSKKSGATSARCVCLCMSSSHRYWCWLLVATSAGGSTSKLPSFSPGPVLLAGFGKGSLPCSELLSSNYMLPVPLHFFPFMS